MKYFYYLAFLFVLGTSAQAQKFESSKSYIKFYSSAPMEDIEATNETVKSIIDLDKGEMVYSVKIKDFQFEKSLMQEHFNENYLESEKYPKSTFSGIIKNWNKQEGEQEVVVAGKLSIHGITKEVEISGKINYSGDQVTVYAKFPVELKDYKVKIPKALFYNIAESVEVTVDFEYKKL